MLIFVSGFVAGVWLLQQQALLPDAIDSLAILPAFALLIALNSQRSRLPWFAMALSTCLLAGIIGYFYATLLANIRLDDQLPKSWEHQKIEVVGVIASLPVTNAHVTRFHFDVEQVITADAVVPKHIGLRYYFPREASTNTLAGSKPSPFEAGQRWQLTVRLKRPHSTYNPQGFDFEAWALAQDLRAVGTVQPKSPQLLLKHFVWQPGYVIEHLRAKIAYRIAQVLGNTPTAGVIRALVIGDSSQVNPSIWQIFLRTGTNHLMSISGLHITMLAGLCYAVVAFFWRRIPSLVLYAPVRVAASIMAALAALCYACLAGLSVPTQRTLYMLLTLLLGLIIGRRIAFTHLLALALLLVVILDPWAVLAPGFWLSFAAVAFIAASTLYRLHEQNKWMAAVNTQWAVTIGLLPFLIFMFGQASIVSPIANALAIPVISLLVVPLALAGSIVPVDFILNLANDVLHLCLQGLSALAGQPLATWHQAVAPWWMFILALLGVFWLLLPKGFPQRYLGVVLLLPMLCYSPSGLMSGEMQVTVLDVGQGLSVVVKTANHTLLYDAGPFYNPQSDAGAKIVTPFLLRTGVRQLDGMVISHHDSDHSGGAASVLAQLPVKWLASSYPFPDSQISKRNTLRCQTGQHWQWDGVYFEMLYPTDAVNQDTTLKDNNRSCVLKITSRYGSLLLTGDIERLAEKNIAEHEEKTLRSDVLIAPHHGSKTSSSRRFIDLVHARYVIFTVGYLNRFHHPDAQVLQRYVSRGSKTYRSDYDGALIIDFKQDKALVPQAWRQRHARYWQDKYL